MRENSTHSKPLPLDSENELIQTCVMSTHICPRCDGEDGYQTREQRLRNTPVGGNPNYWANQLLKKTEAVYVDVWKCKACGEYMITHYEREQIKGRAQALERIMEENRKNYEARDKFLADLEQQQKDLVQQQKDRKAEFEQKKVEREQKHIEQMSEIKQKGKDDRAELEQKKKDKLAGIELKHKNKITEIEQKKKILQQEREEIKQRKKDRKQEKADMKQTKKNRK